MKKIILLTNFLFCILSTYAQNGIENIIVEKYYISDANDTAENSTGGVLPLGSTTYRIYVDMLPGYRFQAAFGTTAFSVPQHELRITTSTLFFNNEYRGNNAPTYNKTQAKSNTLMLDSWLSAGAACAGNFGVLKADDDGVGTVVNKDGLLANNDAAAGIPLTTEDGMIAGNPQPVTLVGLTNEITMFNDQNDGTNGPVFSTWDGSWASLNGSIGYDSLDNKVLIAQMTTDGDFSFELNLQIRTPTGGVQQFVAKNPVNDEIMLPGLTYFSPGVATNAQKVQVVNSFVNIYPNPVSDAFTIAIENAEGSNNYYSIYDAKGSLVAHKLLESSSPGYTENVNVSNFPSGLFFVIVSINGTTTARKIVKS